MNQPYDREHPHPLYSQLKRLAELGWLIASPDSEDPATGEMRYDIDSERVPLLLPILSRPETWDESPSLAECKLALQLLRERAQQDGMIALDNGTCRMIE